MAEYISTYVENGETKPFPNPSRPLQEGTVSNVLTFSADSGYEKRRIKSPMKATFDLTYNVLTDTAYQALKAFYFDRGGEFEAFTWTHPVSKTEYNVKFNGPIQAENFAHNPKTALWKVSVKLIQVF